MSSLRYAVLAAPGRRLPALLGRSPTTAALHRPLPAVLPGPAVLSAPGTAMDMDGVSDSLRRCRPGSSPSLQVRPSGWFPVNGQAAGEPAGSSHKRLRSRPGCGSGGAGAFPQAPAAAPWLRCRRPPGPLRLQRRRPAATTTSSPAPRPAQCPGPHPRSGGPSRLSPAAAKSGADRRPHRAAGG